MEYSFNFKLSALKKNEMSQQKIKVSSEGKKFVKYDQGRDLSRKGFMNGDISTVMSPRNHALG